MTTEKLTEWMKRMPVVAILRGVKKDEAADIAAAVHRAGIGVIEVPLNSPEPLASIRAIVDHLDDSCVVGAGTVLDVNSVAEVASAGGEIVVSPNSNTRVISRSVELGLSPMPGWATPTEAFAAYDAGARYLKLFPASTYGPDHVSACCAVLPSDVRVLAVGGASAADMGRWLSAGVFGFGIGSELYKPGFTPDQVFERATDIVTAYRKAVAP